MGMEFASLIFKQFIAGSKIVTNRLADGQCDFELLSFGGVNKSKISKQSSVFVSFEPQKLNSAIQIKT